MRQGIKMTTGYQLRYMLLVQLMASFVAFILIMIAFAWSLDKNFWKELLSIIFIIMNGGMIYSYANKFAVQDNKPYTPMKVNRLKGVMMGVVISIVTLILFGIDKWVWHVWGTESYLNNWWAIGYNLVFTFCTFPYFGIMGASHGIITWYSAVAFVVVPPLCSWLGYIAGCKKFTLLEVFSKFSYEKKK